MNDGNVKKYKNGGGETSFNILYKKYLSKVYHFTRLYITNDIEVEEIVQETFVKIWENIDNIDETQNIEGYIFIITRNLIFNYSRKSFNNDFYKVTVMEAIEESYDIEAEMDAEDLKKYINSLIDMLPPRQKEVFLLSREEHLSYKEIALRLDITEKTVERHINEALKFLKKSLKLFILFCNI